MRVSLHRGLPVKECNGRTLTRALEWNLQFYLTEYLVDRRGRVRKVFLKSKNRMALVDEGFQARKTFHIHEYLDHFRAIHLGVSAHVLVLPIFQSTSFSSHDVAILIAKNRSFTRTRLLISGRAQTPFPHSKFREFNELPHLFERHLKESYLVAAIYMKQFPNEKLAIVIRLDPVTFLFDSRVHAITRFTTSLASSFCCRPPRHGH